MLQSFLLADESTCLKATISWTGSDAKTIKSIYSKPELNWTSEARKVAAEWMAGPPAQLVPVAEETGTLHANVEAAV